MGHPIVGDPIYRPRKLFSNLEKRAVPLPAGTIDLLKSIPRQMLHAWQLGFTHPRTDETMSFQAPLPDDMVELIGKLSE